MQAGARLVEDIEDSCVRLASEMRGEFQALCLATGESGGGLAEAEIAEAYFFENFQARDYFGKWREESQGFADG